MNDDCILVLDTCGERASLALTRGDAMLGASVLEERAASTVLLHAVRELLATAGVGLEELHALGVVNGPGSFTGLRVGLATAKGLSEALDLPLVAVSRLAVLAAAGEPGQGWAVLRAGREEVYARRAGPEEVEQMLPNVELLRLAAEEPLVYTEASLAPLFAAHPNARQVDLGAREAVPLIRQRLQGHAVMESALLDANYVRNEQAIYKQKQVAQKPAGL